MSNPCKYTKICEDGNYTPRRVEECTSIAYENCKIARFFDVFPEYYENLSDLELGCGAMMVPPPKDI